MTMLPSVLAGTGWFLRKFLLAISLSLVGLVVGVGCVLAPSGAPFGIVGLAGLILLWTMPDLQSVPSRLSRLSVGPLIFVSLSVPYYLAIIIPGAPLISIRRFFLYGFVAVMTITLSASTRYRLLLIQRLRAVPVLSFFIFSYIALLTVTIPFSAAPVVTLNGLIQAAMASYLPILAVVLFVENDEDVISIFKIIMLCLFIDFLIGTVEVFIERPVPWQLLPAASRAYLLANNPLFIGMETGNFRNGTYRAMSTYTVGLSWAEMVAMAAPVSAYFIAHGKSSSGRPMGVLGIIACIISLIYAGSRGGYVCTIAALSVYIVLWAIREVRLYPKSLFGGIALFSCLCVVLTVFLAIAFVPKFHIIVFGNGATQASNMGRDMQWAEAIPIIQRSPIWGHGFAAAGELFNKKTPWGADFTLDDYRINLLVESGVLGFALFFGSLFVAIWISARIYVTSRAPVGTTGATIACALIAYAIDRTTTSQSDNNTLMYVMLGVVFVLDRVARLDIGCTKSEQPFILDINSGLR